MHVFEREIGGYRELLAVFGAYEGAVVAYAEMQLRGAFPASGTNSGDQGQFAWELGFPANPRHLASCLHCVFLLDSEMDSAGYFGKKGGDFVEPFARNFN
jgi:hypothetical protein